MSLFGSLFSNDSASTSTSNTTSNAYDNRVLNETTTTNNQDQRDLSTYNAFPDETARIFFSSVDSAYSGVNSILGQVLDTTTKALDTAGNSSQAVIMSLAKANDQQQQTQALGQGIILKDVLPYVIGGIAILAAIKFAGK